MSAIVGNIEGKSAIARDHHVTWTRAFLHGSSPLDGGSHVTSTVASSNGVRVGSEIEIELLCVYRLYLTAQQTFANIRAYAMR